MAGDRIREIKKKPNGRLTAVSLFRKPCAAPKTGTPPKEWVRMESIGLLRRMIAKSKNLVLFTGAGISVESGIPDFRSAGGIYSGPGFDGYTPEQMVSHSFFTGHTREFYRFYREKMVYPDALPNASHRYFAELEKAGKRVTVVTQNIDGLHRAAGSKNVIELHGSVLRNHCMQCGKFYGVETILKTDDIPRCSCGGVVKPDVVLYEEPLDGDVIARAVRAIAACDLLIVAGTSLSVQPAASFVSFARGKRVLLNQGETASRMDADLVFRTDIGEVIAALAEETI